RWSVRTLMCSARATSFAVASCGSVAVIAFCTSRSRPHRCAARACARAPPAAVPVPRPGSRPGIRLRYRSGGRRRGDRPAHLHRPLAARLLPPPDGAATILTGRLAPPLFLDGATQLGGVDPFDIPELREIRLHLA